MCSGQSSMQCTVAAQGSSLTDDDNSVALAVEISNAQAASRVMGQIAFRHLLHTAVMNSINLLKSLALDVEEFLYALLGGDDSAVATLKALLVDFRKSRALRLEITIEARTVGYFEYHTYYHMPHGSFPLAGSNK